MGKQHVHFLLELQFVDNTTLSTEVTISTIVRLAAEIKFHPEGQTALNRAAEECLSVALAHDEMGCLDLIW